MTHRRYVILVDWQYVAHPGSQEIPIELTDDESRALKYVTSEHALQVARLIHARATGHVYVTSIKSSV